MHPIHWLITTWFQFIGNWGYTGVFLLMAMESSIIPLPSEVVIPPAAYYAAIGRYDMALIVLAGTLGSLFGSLLMYAASNVVGRPVLMKYGKYVFLAPDKIELGEKFFLRYSTGGIFFSRLIPVVRHLCSIPAGVSKMNLGSFVLMTTLGAGLWCSILAWFGKTVIGADPHLLDTPDTLGKVLGHKSLQFGIAAGVSLVVYVLVARTLKSAPEKQVG